MTSSRAAAPLAHRGRILSPVRRLPVPSAPPDGLFAGRAPGLFFLLREAPDRSALRRRAAVRHDLCETDCARDWRGDACRALTCLECARDSERDAAPLR